jgi:hypothetical protein
MTCLLRGNRYAARQYAKDFLSKHIEAIGSSGFHCIYSTQPEEAIMRSIDKQEVLRLLKKGIQADIWYDAADHEDEVAWQTIEDVQGAMQRAIALLEKPEEATK